MSFDETNYPSVANLIGNVSIPRNILPAIRSSVRRSDPDGGSAVPYYPGVATNDLIITYTQDVAPTTATITLSSNSLATIISEINAEDPTHLEALDQDGFLVIRNKNPGKTNYIRVDVCDAAAPLGFAENPLPGSISFAGEYAATPGTRKQSNPQTTALMGLDEDLSSSAINRGFYSILQMVESLRADLNRDTIVYKELDLNFTLNASTGFRVGGIADNSLRVYAPGLDTSDPKVIEHRYRVVGGRTDAINSGDFSQVSVANIYYANAVGDTMSSLPFAVWGTPDGKSVLDLSIPNKDKHASVAITSIVGNVIKCAGATFSTRLVKKGDPVQLTASNLQPFDHSGWFVVDGVIDQETIAVRPMSDGEYSPTVAAHPRWLNPSAGGTLRVAVGWFIPAGNLFVAIAGAVDDIYRIRLPIGVPLREALLENMSLKYDNSLTRSIQFLLNHLNDTTDAHAATAITGFTTTNTWFNGSSVTGATLKAVIEDIVRDLAENVDLNNNGANLIGAPAQTAGSFTVTANHIRSQLGQLLTHHNNHVTDTTDAHLASAIGYGGGGTWADGTTNPAATVEAQLDKIISDLAGAAGTGKIQGSAVGGDLSAGTLATQITNLVNNWGKLSRVNTWTAMQSFLASLATAADARGARLDVDYSGTHEQTLLWQTTRDSGSGPGIRLYASSAGALSITVNAVLSGANTWTKDVNGTEANRIQLNTTEFRVDRQTAALNSWNESSWVSSIKSTRSLEPVAAAAIRPGISFTGYLGTNTVMDYLGFLGGSRITEVTQNWVGTFASNILNDWTRTVSGTGTVTNPYITSNLNGPHGAFTLPASGDAAQIESPIVLNAGNFYGNECVHVLECEVDTDLLDVGVTFKFGLANDVATSNHDELFIRSVNGGNWELSAQENIAGSSSTTTGQAVSGAVTTLRLEIYGDEVDGGPTPKAVAFINGVPRAVHTTDIPNAEDMKIVVRVSSSGVTNKTIRVSPIRYRMRRIFDTNA